MSSGGCLHVAAFRVGSSMGFSVGTGVRSCVGVLVDYCVGEAVGVGDVNTDCPWYPLIWVLWH